MRSTPATRVRLGAPGEVVEPSCRFEVLTVSAPIHPVVAGDTDTLEIEKHKKVLSLLPYVQ